MGASLRVARKELLLFFSSPVAWLFLAAFAGSSLFLVFWVESWFARNIADLRPLFQWQPVLLVFLCSALSMRMWSDERRAGHLEHMLTQPAGLWPYVLGKFMACLALLLLALAGTLPLAITAGLIADLDPGPVYAAFLATLLLGAAYLAIGLCISSRCDNAIVSLIISSGVCGGLYLLGSPLVTDFFASETAQTLRLLGTGSRFESLARGVLDARDLTWYLSLCLGALALNGYLLERDRWARGGSRSRHWEWRAALLLLMLNLLLTNTWMARMQHWRLDLTRDQRFSLSPSSTEILAQLREPLLLRGYFSEQTHPLLSPLVPQMQDLLLEYSLASGGKVRAEWLDPAEHPEQEQEANERYGITATPLRVADRHRSSLVNAYFHVLVRYGDEFRSLGYNDLIEVKVTPENQPRVVLRNPEYDLSRAIKDVLYRYRVAGDLFDGIEQPVEFIGYVSADERLPPLLRRYRQAIATDLEELNQQAKDKFSVRFIQPEAGDGSVAQQIATQWGFKPLTSSADDQQDFYFYLTLADRDQVVQLPTDDFDEGRFQATLRAGLKRFAANMTHTVALALPGPGKSPQFNQLEEVLALDYSLVREDLDDGEITPQADILLVLAPEELPEAAVYAVDQFLMRGGTVILATSPFVIESTADGPRAKPRKSGLEDWLAHHGLVLDKTLVLDRANMAFPAGITRNEGDREFRELQLIDYPYFIDLRRGGLLPGHPVTDHLPQLTMAWASPIEADRSRRVRLTTLLRSSAAAWLSDSRDVLPSAGDSFSADGPQKARDLGITLQGRLPSYFRDRPVPDTHVEPGFDPGVIPLIETSPESARLVLLASNEFLGDRALTAQTVASGSEYRGPLELLQNTLDWALEDGRLMEIRSRSHFNQTLPALERSAQLKLEYFNYTAAGLWVLLLVLVHLLMRYWRKRRYRRSLEL